MSLSPHNDPVPASHTPPASSHDAPAPAAPLILPSAADSSAVRVSDADIWRTSIHDTNNASVPHPDDEDDDDGGSVAGPVDVASEAHLAPGEMSEAARYAHSFGYHFSPTSTTAASAAAAPSSDGGAGAKGLGAAGNADELAAALAALTISSTSTTPAAASDASGAAATTTTDHRPTPESATAAADSASFADTPDISLRSRSALFYDSRVLLHQANYNHVEGPQRVLRSFEALVNSGLWEQCAHVTVGGEGYDGFGAPSSTSTSTPLPSSSPGKNAENNNDEKSPALASFTASLRPRLTRPLVVTPLYSVPRPLLPVAPVALTHSSAAIARVAAASDHQYGPDEPDSEDESGDPTVFPDCKYLDASRDTYINAFTPVSTRVALTGVVACTRAVASGAVRTAFALLRPPGHHASREGQAGFCLFNNVAVAVNDARKSFPGVVKRVLVVDWDVHHGDGTQALFYDDPDVLFVSLHRYEPDFFPGTGASSEIGAGAGRGMTINIPFPGAEYGDTEYIAAFDALILPIARAFRPDIVVVSAGMDCLISDPLGGMSVTPQGLATITRRLRDPSLGAQGRVVAVLEGGYNPAAVAEGVCAVVAALGGIEPLTPVGEALTLSNSNAGETLAASNSSGQGQSGAVSSSSHTRRGANEATYRLRRAAAAVAATAKKLAPVWPVAGEIAKAVEKHGLVKAAEMMNKVSAALVPAPAM